jgi:hypothetical protein
LSGSRFFVFCELRGVLLPEFGDLIGRDSGRIYSDTQGSASANSARPPRRCHKFPAHSLLKKMAATLSRRSDLKRSSCPLFRGKPFKYYRLLYGKCLYIILLGRCQGVVCVDAALLPCESARSVLEEERHYECKVKSRILLMSTDLGFRESIKHEAIFIKYGVKR